MKKNLFFLLWIVLGFTLPAFAQNDTIINQMEVADTVQWDFGLFSKQDILNISLRFDITEYKKEKSKTDYLKAILTYHIDKNDSVNKEILLKSRGNMRNGYCSFPPIRLNFRKTEFQKNDLNKIETLKMVTHCQYGNEENLFKEYLVYKLYNVLTDYSFHVRLVKVEYINTAKKSKPINTYAFFIEPIEMVGERTKSIPVNLTNLTQKNIVPEMMDRMAIFNYMIGNTDWSVPINHNFKVLSSLNFEYPGLGIIVPYDFDYAGLVNTTYAVPYDGLGLKSVRERRYLGICRSEDVYINALREFTDKKEELYRVIRDFPLLKERTKKDMLDYLDTFYDGIGGKNNVVFDMLNGCIRF